jgi:hypothetical protein
VSAPVWAEPAPAGEPAPRDVRHIHNRRAKDIRRMREGRAGMVERVRTADMAGRADTALTVRMLHGRDRVHDCDDDARARDRHAMALPDDRCNAAGRLGGGRSHRASRPARRSLSIPMHPMTTVRHPTR